jgi:tRNA (adenine22-N1)-methyltransferase
MARITMSSSREGERLSRRLKTIQSFYKGQDHIWDIGCDHGLLGLSFRHLENVKGLYLVDPSKEVINTLTSKFKDSYITRPALFIKNMAGQDLKITTSSNSFFIAGMGGKEIGEIVTHLLPQVGEDSQFVISPHRKILEVRDLLSKLPLTLIDEKVVFEEGQFYQILSLVPGGEGPKVSPYGEKEFWSDDDGSAYKEHQIKAYSQHRDEASKAYVTYLQSLK